MSRLQLFALFASITFLVNCASASLYPHGTWLKGDTVQTTSLDDPLNQVSPGSIVLVSEFHNHGPHHANQIEVINKLKQKGFTVSVGLEFFNYTDQKKIEDFLAGKMSESDFLKAIKWGKDNFANWRTQVRSTLGTNGSTLGLNAPRTLSRAISRNGLDSLTPEQQAILPPNFRIGSKNYRERFENIMGGGHSLPKDAMDRYFTSQSLWDDTMAWIAREYIVQNPTHVLVICVGDFHAAFGGGLPDRLKARGQRDITVLSQINTRNMSEADQRSAINPHNNYGPRADGIFISTESL